MARFPQITDTAESPALASLYADIVAHGFGTDTPINWFTVQGKRPDLLDGSWSLAKSILVDGRLPATVKQLIAVAVSVRNDCRYCSVVHRGALEAMGVDTDVIEKCVSNVEGASLPPIQREIVRFATKAARTPAKITGDDLNVLRDGGLGDEEILEVTMMAAFTNFINAWADISGIPLDE